MPHGFDMKHAIVVRHYVGNNDYMRGTIISNKIMDTRVYDVMFNSMSRSHYFIHRLHIE